MKTLRSLRNMLSFLSFVLIYLCCSPVSSTAQKKALNIPGIYQLVSDSKSEFDRQNVARNQQIVTTANEQANKTMLARLKLKYRELQQRYHALGTAIDAANIGIHAAPMVNHIIRNQMEIYRIAQQEPLFIGMAYQTETEFVTRSRSLLNYLIGLCASIGAVNQMKASDRKILFDHVLMELNTIQELSSRLSNAMQISHSAGLLRSLNPFQNYVDQDREIIDDIIRNAGYLKR
ncbi:hypothetical protein [Pedobacter nyackensis]|uniref:hypothetical protein n=1 Tax=Pedobacter nyackensis TaxID=475255 RepID=UPI0029307E21|nr:hypothetical protein [Pedobacter nyackensis]